MWFDSTVTSMRKLKIAYNNSLRRVLNLSKCNSASEMFVNLNILSYDQLLRKFVCSFMSRIQDSGNSLVNGIVKSFLPLFNEIWAWWSVQSFSTDNHYKWSIVVCENELYFWSNIRILFSFVIICKWYVCNVCLYMYILDHESVTTIYNTEEETQKHL